MFAKNSKVTSRTLQPKAFDEKLDENNISTIITLSKKTSLKSFVYNGK